MSIYKGEYSCAGATRALGMVLECMGYKWEHVNPNQWTHQWCKVTMDGQAGWQTDRSEWQDMVNILLYDMFVNGRV